MHDVTACERIGFFSIHAFRRSSGERAASSTVNLTKPPRLPAPTPSRPRSVDLRCLQGTAIFPPSSATGLENLNREFVSFMNVMLLKESLDLAPQFNPGFLHHLSSHIKMRELAVGLGCEPRRMSPTASIAGCLNRRATTSGMASINIFLTA